MKQLGLFCIAALGMCSQFATAQLPNPTYGWNLGNTMEPPSGVGTWGGTASQALINAASNAGFNAVRIPCAWDSHANQTTYQIDPVYMSQVKQVVDWCLAKNMVVVINCHWDGGWLENHLTGNVNPTINAKMGAYWSQIATAFASYDKRLLFAAANEPNVDNAAKMAELNVYYQTFVDAVRRAKGMNYDRWLVFQGPIDYWTGFPQERFSRTKPMRFAYEAHCYTPSLFCFIHNDPSWGRSIFYWGQGYHSATDTSRNATWGEETTIDAEMQAIYDKFTSKKVPVILGEFGAYPYSSLTGANSILNFASTTYWNKYVQQCARSRGISPFWWSTPGSIFDWSTGAVTDQQTLNAITPVGTAVPPPGGDGSQFCFELSSQAWWTSGSPIGSVGISQAQSYLGASSLAINFNGTSAGTASAGVNVPSVPPGKAITFRVWVPSNNALGSIQAYAMDRNWSWAGDWKSASSLVPNAWNTFTVSIPPGASFPLQQLGVQFSTTGAWTGTCYVDSISW